MRNIIIIIIIIIIICYAEGSKIEREYNKNSKIKTAK